MKTILIFLSLLLVSCGISKDKLKQKKELNFTEKSKQKTELQQSENTVSSVAVKKLFTSSVLQNKEQEKFLQTQNFQLKNNGKCSDPGTTRNVEFTDALGNKTKIPINDNTELNFGSLTEIQKENETLKAENKQQSSEIQKLEKQFNETTKKLEKAEKQLKERSVDVETKTKKNPIGSYLFTVFASIVIWEVIRRKLI